MEHKKYKNRFLRHLISIPISWIQIIPAVILDISIEIYHRICFPLYKLPLVKRSKYIKIDRHKLKYLSPLDKLSCVYCGYVNGLLHYVSVIAGETEKYWCGIKHKPSKNFIEPKHHKKFIRYDDEKTFKEKFK